MAKYTLSRKHADKFRLYELSVQDQAFEVVHRALDELLVALTVSGEDDVADFPVLAGRRALVVLPEFERLAISVVRSLGLEEAALFSDARDQILSRALGGENGP